MELKSIKTSLAYESSTNPRGKDFEGAAFDDLVASVKEKGVLVPVIARPKEKGEKQFEIVAGNRRFRAAKVAGLAEIPARIETLTDEEAREVQIIENLHREDVHPLEEALAYRELIEKSKFEIPAIAAKVGKSESYVRQRLFLTRLETAVANAYRTAKMTDGHAVMIAKLSANDQASPLKFITSSWRLPSLSDLKGYIDREFSHPLEHQPWLKDQDALAAVGSCKECPPNMPGLFGAVKQGACTDKKCWRRKMAKYIAYRKEKNPELILVSKNYGMGNDDVGAKGILSANNYEKPGPKDKCRYSVMALVAKGEGLGSMIRICVAKECKIHGKRHRYVALTPKEQAKREKEEAAEKAREEKRRQKERDEMAAALKRVKWPLTRKTLDVILQCAFRCDTDFDKVGERRYPDTKPPKGQDYVDWDAVLRRAAQTMSDEEKSRLVVEIMLGSVWGDEEQNKLMKLL